jgi:hypothetical protein
MGEGCEPLYFQVRKFKSFKTCIYVKFNLKQNGSGGFSRRGLYMAPMGFPNWAKDRIFKDPEYV